MKTRFYSILILFAFLVSCTSHENIHLIEKAETILDSSPDSALHLLDSIKNPKSSLNKKYYMKYIVLDVLAKYKTYQDIKKDSLIFDAAKYFNSKANLNDKALANYAAASVLNENEKYTDAMTYYKNAEKVLENSDNYLMKGIVENNIAVLYDRELTFGEAVNHFKDALKEFSKLKDSQLQQINTLIFLGSEYLNMKQVNRALDCYQRAYNLSLEMQDVNSQAMLLNNIGLVYQKRQEYNNALKYFSRANDLNIYNKAQKYRIILNLSSSYLSLNKIDSANKYVKQLENSIDSVANLSYLVSLTIFLKDYYRNIGDIKKTFYFQELNSTFQYQLFDENQSKKLIDADKKFDYTVHKVEAEKARLMQRLYALILIGVFLLVAIISVAIWYRYRQQKLVQAMERQALQMKQHQQEMENQQLQRELGRFKYINIALNKVMEKANELHLELNDIVQAGILHEKSERYLKIQSKLKDTQDTIKENIAINADSFLIERNLIEKEILNKLTEEEKIILTMLFYKESRKNIASLLSISPQAVYNRVPRLKNKLILLGISEEKTSIFFSKLDFNDEIS